MNKTRLMKVVTRLREIRVLQALGKIETRFDMASWGRLEEYGKFKNRKDMSCLTAACAIGHCGTIFKKEGFKLKIDTFNNDQVIPSFQNKIGYSAVADLFKITYEEAMNLFCPQSYRDEYGKEYNPSPNEVADRIENFVYGIQKEK